jgi:putative hydrolase of the HAD superfamily
LRALTRSNVEPSESLFVGDNISTDIIGAKNVGMTTVWKAHSPIIRPPQADYVISNISELMSILDVRA